VKEVKQLEEDGNANIKYKTKKMSTFMSKHCSPVSYGTPLEKKSCSAANYGSPLDQKIDTKAIGQAAKDAKEYKQYVEKATAPYEKSKTNLSKESYERAQKAKGVSSYAGYHMGKKMQANGSRPPQEVRDQFYEGQYTKYATIRKPEEISKLKKDLNINHNAPLNQNASNNDAEAKRLMKKIKKDAKNWESSMTPEGRSKPGVKSDSLYRVYETTARKLHKKGLLDESGYGDAFDFD